MVNKAKAITYRPRLVWRVVAPLVVAVAVFSIIEADGRGGTAIYLLAIAGGLVWTGYLWTARLVIEGEQARLGYFGKQRPAVDTGSLVEFEQRLTKAFPGFSPMIVITDRSGHSLSLTQLYWNGWKELRAMSNPDPVDPPTWGFTKRVAGDRPEK